MDFTDILFKYLNGEQLNELENSFLMDQLKRIADYAYRTVSAYNFKPDFDAHEEALNELFECVKAKKNVILARFGNNKKGIKSYIKTMLLNKLKDRIRKNQIESRTIDMFRRQELPLDNIINQPKKVLLYIDSCDLIDILDTVLTKSEKEAICAWLDEKTVPSKSSYALDKARSRAKKRIKEIVIEKSFPEEVVEFALKYLFMSKICDRIVNKDEG